ncbi:MAG: hypothetical protein JWO56_3323 [Acidobacteria bacterium]|nr:hypothetical protein [Acidobacteriota bacterium]
MTPSSRTTAIVGAAIAAVSAALHVIFLQSAGAFWRDELVSIRVAASPTLSAWMQRLQFESFGAVWQLLLRAWMSVAGDAIPTLRLLGFLIGLGILAATFMASRITGSGTPLFALAVIGTNAALIRSGDAIRGYGLGVLLGILTVAALQRAVTLRTRNAWLLAAIVAIAGVQTSYYNAVLLFACCVAAAAVAGRDFWKPLAMGALAAASLLPYLGAMRARAQWTVLETYDVPLSLWIRNARDVFASSGRIAAVITILTIGLAIATGIVLAVRKRPYGYPLLVMAVFTIGHFVFLHAVGYFPQPWYYAILLAVLAFCADGLLPPPIRMAAALLVVVTAVPGAARAVAVRQTNADQAAALVAARARPGDAIIVYPWYCGLSFDAYYRGAVPWMTLPPLRDVSLQRYDLVNRAVADRDAALPAVAAASRALREGHHVWLIGFPLFADRAAAADRRAMTAVEAADQRWCSALLDVVQHEATRMARRLKGDARISLFERFEVVEFAP